MAQFGRAVLLKHKLGHYTARSAHYGVRRVLHFKMRGIIVLLFLARVLY